jgi:hypothetical protein
MKRIVTVFILVASSYLCTAPRSVAQSVSAYLGSRYTSAHVPCGSRNYLRLMGTYNQKPEDWNSGWRVHSHTYGESKFHIITDTYYMDGVSRYKKYQQCSSGDYGFRLVPDAYVHRFNTKVWACGAGSCTRLSSITTNWANGVARR